MINFAPLTYIFLQDYQRIRECLAVIKKVQERLQPWETQLYSK